MKIINLIVVIALTVVLSVFTKANNAEMCIIYILMYQTSERIIEKYER